MPFEIIKNDITKVPVDAIVNAANESLLGGGGVDGAIHRAAGPSLLEECRTLGGCKTGEAKITKGYNLSAKYVIHTVGPVWHGGKYNEDKLLANCYKNSLKLAREYKLKSIAFPLISAGAFGYPKCEALQVAISVIREFVLKNDMLVYLVVFDMDSFVMSESLFSSLEHFIDEHYIEEEDFIEKRRNGSKLYLEPFAIKDAEKSYQGGEYHLQDKINQMDETFSQMLLRLIDEKGMTDAEVYRKANIDRRHFSKIRNNIDYNPSKNTGIAFAIALELNLDETKDLLLKAGYALSHSNKFDIIIEYFIENGKYNIFEINEALFAFHQKLLAL